MGNKRRLIKKGLNMIKKYQSLVHQTIPLTHYMQWRIEELNENKINASVPLQPNINIHQTGFAGSIYAGAMATGWTLLKFWCDSHHYSIYLVAAEASISYHAPVTDNFECRAEIDTQSAQYQKLLERMQQNKSCAFAQKVEVICHQKKCAILTIQFIFKQE